MITRKRMFMRWRRRGLRALCITRPHDLWKRYALAFSLIAVLIGSSHYASLVSISESDGFAEMINVAGRQRMLSQRILFYVNEIHLGANAEARQELRLAVEAFERGHQWLVTRPDLPMELRQFYDTSTPIPLDEFSRRYAAMALYYPQADAFEQFNIRNQLTAWGEHDLLERLNEAVGMIETHAHEQTARVLSIQHWTILGAAGILLMEALLIFAPAQYSVSRSIRRLEARKHALHASLSILKKRNAQLLAARESLAFAANHDVLTGLYNRRAVYEHLNAKGTTEQGADFARCIMKVDLDDFKTVNDSLGHDAGDLLLVHVADVLRQHVDAGDVLGRIGGDEFVLIFENPEGVDVIQAHADRIIRALRKPVRLQDSEVRVGASIGLTMATSTTATPDQLLVEADLALYEAKREGRGLARGFSDDMLQEIETRRLLFKEITEALARDEFEPFFQPQVYTHGGAPYGCEVLARWRHPERGLIPPATFIAAAEEAGLVDQIDRLMIEKGLDRLEEMRAQGLDVPAISINASPATLRDPHLTDRLLQDVHARLLEPSDLVVEVLESTLIENDDDIALTTVDALADAGFAVVLDDFGTGYASMSTLSRLRLHGIKLDQSLIRPVPDHRSETIISALVSLSKKLNMRVVAEGVETPAHFRTVKQLGGDVVQGFGIGKPMPFDEFTAWYRTYVETRAKVSLSA
ncbi:MAG: EAL domain-containing protein [Pseudomonadota bacterium]